MITPQLKYPPYTPSGYGGNPYNPGISSYAAPFFEQQHNNFDLDREHEPEFGFNPHHGGPNEQSHEDPGNLAEMLKQPARDEDLP